MTATHLNRPHAAVGRLLDECWAHLGETGPLVRARLIRRAVRTGFVPAPPPLPATLSAAHFELEQWTVLHCTAWGMDAAQIAKELGLPYREVAHLLAGLRELLGARTTAHLVYLASPLLGQPNSIS
ncbi:hypothetical protein ACFVRD_33495 [Streptomyces sp. NPDC057908]|uniref:hypothetical protein n=1 Tax=Streptomyces sp. NPDC057908 TaxID=3346276 RepID=UPI0036E736B1